MIFYPRSGFITLVSVLVVGAVGLSIAVSLLLLGLGSSRTSFALQESNEAKALANACAEEALQKLRESVYYAGNETKTFTLGSCQIQAVSGTGNLSRTLQTVGIVRQTQRKVKVIVSRVHPIPGITSWQEVADF